jgi:hypothetical protein
MSCAQHVDRGLQKKSYGSATSATSHGTCAETVENKKSVFIVVLIKQPIVESVPLPLCV